MSARTLTHNGETRSLNEWAAHTGLSRRAIVYRIDQMGWSVERALTTPAMSKSAAGTRGAKRSPWKARMVCRRAR